MNPRIDIEKVVSPLLKRVYSFVLLDGSLVLDFFAQEERPTPRHKFQVKTYYDRLMTRDSSIKDPKLVPTLPSATEVKARFLEKLEVCLDLSCNEQAYDTHQRNQKDS